MTKGQQKMGKSYRNRIKRINKDISNYLDKGPQDPGPPYKKKRKRLPTDINKLSAPPGAGALEAVEDESEGTPRSGMEEIIEAWKVFVEQEEETHENENSKTTEEQKDLV